VNTDKPYALAGSTQSEQGEASTTNPNSGNVQMRILIELQVISILLMQSGATTTEDLRQLRQNVADSIT
jgi:hypothetical protein